jgi:glutathione synthase
MRITVLVNAIHDVQARQGTSLLAHAARRRGHHVGLCGVADLSWSGGLVVHEVPVYPSSDTAAMLQRVHGAKPVRRKVEPGDVVLIRTNPARDPERVEWHTAALELLAHASDRGVAVLNDPRGLMEARSKLFLFGLPASVVPVTAVSSREDELRGFVRSAGGPCVLKPVSGTRGEGVFLVDTEGTTPNSIPLEDALARLQGGGPIMAQHAVPSYRQGDTRVLLVEGKPLTVGGRRATVRRIPPAEDFRSNIHVGGSPEPGVWTPGIEAAVRGSADVLREMGLFLVGLDVIGDRIIEVNVFSPGGFGSAYEFEGVDFAGAVIGHLERKLATGA